MTQDKRDKKAKKPEKDPACIPHDHDEQDLLVVAFCCRQRLVGKPFTVAIVCCSKSISV